MKPKHIFNIIKTKILSQRKPLIVGWSLTNRCGHNCIYCDINNTRVPELRYPDIKKVLDQLIQNGLFMVHYTGGDPLLHPDFQKIFDYSIFNNLIVNINTSSERILEYKTIMKYTNQIGVSIDGPKEINVLIRGEGTYQQMISILLGAQYYNTRTRINTVITSLNIKYLLNIINIAKKYKTTVMFQPVTLSKLYSNNTFEFIPDKKGYNMAIDMLINQKKAGAPIANSVAGLKILRHWPESYPVKCTGGIISFRIEPDGSISACPRRYDTLIKPNDKSIIENFHSLKTPDCDRCWCAGRLEMNLAYNGNINACINTIRTPFIIPTASTIV